MDFKTKSQQCNHNLHVNVWGESSVREDSLRHAFPLLKASWNNNKSRHPRSEQSSQGRPHLSHLTSLSWQIFLTKRCQTACKCFPCSETGLIHFCLLGIELRGSHVKSSLWAWRMRGCSEVSVETCRAGGRQRSLGKWYNGGLGHFRGKTMEPIVISPLTCGTFSSNHFNPQIYHVENVSFHTVAVEATFMCLFKLAYNSVCVLQPYNQAPAILGNAPEMPNVLFS